MLFIVPRKGRIFLVLVILGVYWYNFQQLMPRQELCKTTEAAALVVSVDATAVARVDV